MPEIVPDDGAKDPIIQREQQPTVCTEDSIAEIEGATGRVRFCETSLKGANSSKLFMRSYSAPDGKYQGGTKPFDRVEDSCKTIETQTSRQEVFPEEGDNLLHHGEDNCANCGKDIETGPCDGKMINERCHRSHVERRCTRMIISTFVVIFLLLAVLAVTFFTLGGKQNESLPPAEAQHGMLNQSSEGVDPTHTCPTFAATIITKDIQLSKPSDEFRLPWKHTTTKVPVDFLQLADDKRDLHIKSPDWYTIHVMIHVDTSLHADPTKNKTYTSSLCINIKDSISEPVCSRKKTKAGVLDPLAVQTRTFLKKGEIVQIYLKLENVAFMKDGKLEMHHTC